MSISLFLAPLLFQHDLMVLFPHILHVCLHLNQSDPETQPAYAAERSSFANCIQCSSNFLCSSFTNSLYGCTCKLSRSPNAQLRGLDCFFFFYRDCFRLLTSWCCFLLIFKSDIYLAPSLWWILCLCNLSPFPGHALSEATTGFPRFSFMEPLSQILF
jgi:hypothetical protein